MLKVSCRYLTLSEVSSDFDITAYDEFVRPLEYDFGLVRNNDYQVIGVIERKGTPWLYIIPFDGDIELDVVPAVLFSFERAAIPFGMIVRLTSAPQPSLEILPEGLAAVDDWFERYVDGDEGVVAIIESEVRRSR